MTDKGNKKPLIVLGVESSCDETACALVADGRRVLSSVVASQIDMHRRFGGVVPEVASRAHIEAIGEVLDESLETAEVASERIDAIAVTSSPGLIGSLLVGVTAAKTLAFAWGKPLVAVNHVHAHAYSPALEAEPIEYPAVALVVSGGHTALYECRSPVEVISLGQTIDDAAGEAFDKAANILHLGYPGGPAIERAARGGDPDAVPLPRTLLKGQSLDFSFSGLKTAVLYHVNGVPNATLALEVVAAKGPGYGKGAQKLSAAEIADIAASFQAAVADVLAIKLRRAVAGRAATATATATKSVILGGGVAANSAIRARVASEAEKLGLALRLPEMRFCTDNAAMVAGLGYHHFMAGELADFELQAVPTMRP